MVAATVTVVLVMYADGDETCLENAGFWRDIDMRLSSGKLRWAKGNWLSDYGFEMRYAVWRD